jgi:hypothetical protein
MCLAPVIRPEGPVPKGQESLAQGLPWVRRNKRFALKGLGLRARSRITQGKPWAKLFWPLRATDWKLTPNS